MNGTLWRIAALYMVYQLFLVVHQVALVFLPQLTGQMPHGFPWQYVLMTAPLVLILLGCGAAALIMARRASDSHGEDGAVTMSGLVGLVALIMAVVFLGELAAELRQVFLAQKVHRSRDGLDLFRVLATSMPALVPLILTVLLFRYRGRVAEWVAGPGARGEQRGS